MKKLILLQVLIFSSLIANCQWQQLPKFTNARLQQIQFVDENMGWINAGKYMNPDVGIIFRTIDGGQTWDSTIFDHRIRDIYFIDSNFGYATGATSNGDSLMKTTDGGVLWTYYPSSIGVENMSFIDADTGWTTTPHSVFRTVDGGNTWAEILAVISPFRVTSLFPIDGDIAYVARKVDLSSGSAVLYTNDGGQTWTDPSPLSWVCTKMHMFSSGIGYGIDNYTWGVGGIVPSFHKTNTQGTTWDEIVSPIQDYEFFNDLYFSNENVGWISISTIQFGLGDGGIFNTFDGGQTWIEQLDKPVSDFSFIDEKTAWALRVTFDPDSSDYVYRTVNGGVGIDEHTTYKDELNLFPNPTTNMVTLSFELPQKENTSISIRNISGQEIVQIPVGSIKIGNYDLNCSDFAPGIYFVTLKTDSGFLSEKLIIE